MKFTVKHLQLFFISLLTGISFFSKFDRVEGVLCDLWEVLSRVALFLHSVAGYCAFES